MAILCSIFGRNRMMNHTYVATSDGRMYHVVTVFSAGCVDDI